MVMLLRSPPRLRDGREAPEATALLPQVLAAQGSGSVVIVSQASGPEAIQCNSLE